jgi:peptide/nickel transport system substrate-binding protein
MAKASMATVALAASLTMLVVGCGTGSSANNGNSSNSSGGTTSNSQTPVDGGTLTIGQGTKFNDQFIPAADASLYTMYIDQFAYDTLLGTDKDLNFVPDLVKSWTWSSDKKTVTMTLANAKWSDGQPITSNDILFTINYLASPAYTKDLQGQYGYLVSAIKGYNKISKGTATSFAETGGFKKIDATHFSLTFDQIDASVLYSMISGIQPIPEHALKDIPISKWGTSSFNKVPTVVSGAYTFVKVNGQDSVEMKANPDYFQGKPHITNVIWKTVSIDVAPGLLANGKVDFMMDGLKPQDSSKLTTIPGIEVKNIPQNGYNYLGLKEYHKEFQNVKVRQAFEYALDRQQMATGIYKGLALPDNSPIPPVSWAAATQADGINPYTYDPAKAKQLLDEAGWTLAPGSKWRIDPVTGKIADLPLSYSSGDPTVQAMAVAIQQNLEAVGVKVTLNSPMDFNTLAKQVENDNKNMWMWLMAWSLSTDPDPRGLWVSTDAFNFERWTNAQSDAMIKTTYSAKAFDKTYRKQQLVKWQVYVNQQMPLNFLLERDQIYAFNKRLHIPADDWSTAGPFNWQQWWLSPSN